MELEELKEKLREIKEKGFIKTKRAHQGGAGNTLEQLLNVKENNLSLPDLGSYELKVKRKSTNSMVSLISKSPNPKGINRILFEEYSTTLQSDNVRRLYTTMSTKLNPQKFYLEPKDDKLFIRNEKNTKGFWLVNDKNHEAYWSIDEIFNKLKEKTQNTLLVTAETKDGTGSKNEEFHFTEAFLLSGLSKEKFLNAIKKNMLVVDIRIGADLTGSQAGKYHDHGTAFRLRSDKLKELFSNIEKVL